MDAFNRAEQVKLCPVPRVPKAVTQIPGPPPGYRQPAKWDQLWLFRQEPERILLATATGWEPIDRMELVDTVKEVQEVNEFGYPVWDPQKGKWKTKRIPWEAVRPRVIWFHGARPEDVKLPSLRIPDEGKREARHG